MGRIRSKRAILFYSILFLFVSCEFNQPVRDYLEYWSSTCQVGKIEYASENVTIDDVPNLSASEPIEINLYTVNPKSIRILCKDNNFSLQNEAGDLSVTDYSETMVDPTYVKIRANLSDASEGQLITLSGCLWPENRLDFPEADLRTSSPELFYTTSFIQNTPPDNIKNLHRAEDYFPGTHKCYISFEVPDQSLNRNKDSSYEVKYFFRNNDNSLEYKGSKVLTLADNKNPSAGSDVFMYYFDGQDDNFLNCYEYTVQVTGPRGLTVGLRATDPALGACVLVEPSITVLDIPNGLSDEDSDGDYECYEVDSDGDAITFTALPGQEGDTLTVTDNGTEMTATSGSTYTVSGSGRHEIKATVSRTDAFSVTVKKRLRIETTPAAAVFSFGMPFNGEGEDDDGYEYIEVSSLDTNPSFTITSPDSGTTFSGSIDGAAFSERSEPKTGNLFVTSHILDAEVHKPYCNPVSSQKKVCVAKSLKEPTITFTPSAARNGNTDSDGYEYYEIASSSARLGYTIEPVSYDKSTNGAKVSGSIGSTTFTETVTKTGDLGTGTYTISVDVKRKGMVSKHYEKKIKIVEALKEPTYSSIPDFNGNTFADFDYVEVSSSSGTVTLTINAATGCTIAGTHSIDSATGTNFNSSSNSYVTLTLGLGNHIITGNVSRTNYTSKSFTKKIKVVESLKEPTYSIEPGFNGKKNSSGFEYVEVPSSSGTATLTITAATDCTITGSYGSTSFNSGTSNTKTITLGIGEYTISGNVNKTGYNSKAFTKKIKIVEELQEPTIRFYKHDGNDVLSASSSAPEQSGYSDYTCYDLPLTASGTGNANFEVYPGSGESVVVKIDGTVADANSSGKRTLALGPHTIELTVKKTNYKDQPFTKKVYIQGELADPKISPNNGTYKSGSGNSSSDPMVYQFSYISYDSMKLKFEPGNSSSGGTSTSLSWKINNLDGTNTTGIQGIGVEETVTIEIKQTRQYCKTNTTTKYALGNIKPITLTYKNNKAGNQGWAGLYICNLGTDKYDLLGSVTAYRIGSNGAKTEGQCVWSYGSDKYGIESHIWDHLHTDTTAHTVQYTLNKTTDKLALELTELRRRNHDGEGKISGTVSRSLSDIKNGVGLRFKTDTYTNEKWTLYTGKVQTDDDYAEVYVRFIVSD